MDERYDADIQIYRYTDIQESMRKLLYNKKGCNVFVFFVFVFCLVYPILSVSMGCPFFIVASVFSNVYLLNPRSISL